MTATTLVSLFKRIQKSADPKTLISLHASFKLNMIPRGLNEDVEAGGLKGSFSASLWVNERLF